MTPFRRPTPSASPAPAPITTIRCSLEDLPRIVHEAFYIASTGHPGPVLVNIPKDIFQAKGEYKPVDTIHLPGYKVPTDGHSGQIRRAAQMIWEAERALVYAGGGIIAAEASAELRELVDLANLPAAGQI